MYTPRQPQQHGRILNRHKRGRPRYGFTRRLQSRARRLVPVLVFMGLAGGGYFVLRWLELV